MVYPNAQLERELNGMRGSGVDLSAKQAEVDAAKRRAQDAHQRWLEAQRYGLELHLSMSYLWQFLVCVNCTASAIMHCLCQGV